MSLITSACVTSLFASYGMLGVSPNLAVGPISHSVMSLACFSFLWDVPRRTAALIRHLRSPTKDVSNILVALFPHLASAYFSLFFCRYHTHKGYLNKHKQINE